MEIPQNSPITPKPIGVIDTDPTVKAVTFQQQAWIDYTALNGLITDLTSDVLNPDGTTATLRKMSITEFAQQLGVDRKTLRNWRISIPNFWERVNARRAELAPQSRLQRMHEVWYLSAQKIGPEGFRDRQLWLANFDPNFRMPTEKVEHEMGNSWAALLQHKRKQMDAIEGEVVNDPTKSD